VKSVKGHSDLFGGVEQVRGQPQVPFAVRNVNAVARELFVSLLTAAVSAFQDNQRRSTRTVSRADESIEVRIESLDE
jgi:hypothetical protein